MLSRSVLYVHRVDAPEEAKQAMLHGLAFLTMEVETVRSADALHLDLEDRAGLEAFEAHPAAQEVAAIAAAATMEELTARVDWRREDVSPGRRGGVRHCAMHVWRAEAEPAERARVLGAAAGLATAAGVESASAGESLGGRAADFDWLLDLRFADLAAATAFLESEPYAQVAHEVAAATKDEWTARVTHRMRSF